MAEKELLERAGELLDKAIEALIEDMKRLVGSDRFYIVSMIAVRDDDGSWNVYHSGYMDNRLQEVIGTHIDGIMHSINLYEQGWDKIEALRQEIERLQAEAERCSSQS